MDNPYYAMWILQKEQIARVVKDKRQPADIRRAMTELLADMAILEAEVILER